jgi:hypothetical protein
VRIADLAPFRRAPGVPIFHDGGEHEFKTASERVSGILRAFASDTPLPPIKVNLGAAPPYKLTLYDGLHRVYCSMAAGFSSVPVIVVERLELGDPI